MSMKKARNLNCNLPDDIFLKILYRCPVKSLLLFTCVSKRWRSIILSDPQFAKVHLKLATEQKTITRRLILSVFPYQFKSLEDSFGYQSSVRNLTIPSGENEKVVISSCNGLVALGNVSNGWSIWNPSTGFERKIPSPHHSLVMRKLHSNPEYDSDFVLDGFGYVSSSDDYKLVLVPAPDKSGSRVVNMFIFSARANSWKLMKASRWPCRCYSPTTNSGTLSNEAIHWVNCYTYKDILGHEDVVEICAFDLDSEKLRKVPLPSFDQNDDEVYKRRTRTVVHAGGYLCVWSETYDDEGRRGGYIEMWMMGDYGVCDSWVKLFKVKKKVLHDVNDPVRFWEPSFVTESGAVVILLDGKELVRIKCYGKDNKKVAFLGRYKLKKELECKLLFGVTLYNETVVSLQAE